MPPDGGARTRRVAAVGAKLLLLVGLLIAVNHGVGLIRDWLEVDLRPSNEDRVHRMIMLAAVLYALALAVPFVPGVEIGLGLIAVFGVDIVPLVYLCTVGGLMLAYLAGRLVPVRVLAELAADLSLTRLAALLRRIEGAAPDELRAAAFRAVEGGPMRALLRHRYVAVALAINLPGNFVIGGGGGIALVAGISRMFYAPLFLLTVLLAVAPVPLLVMLAGPSVLAH